MICTFLGALVIVLFLLSLAVTVVPLVATLYTVPLVEMYLPGVRKVMTSPMWISLPSLSNTLGWDSGHLHLTGLLCSGCSAGLAKCSSKMSAFMQRLLIYSWISSISGLSFIWLFFLFSYRLMLKYATKVFPVNLFT